MKIEVEKLVLGMVSTNVYLVFYNGNCLIIDPSDEAQRIIDCIEERKAKPLAILLPTAILTILWLRLPL